eukprot:3939425-Rhodomonas_salina.1
MVDARLLVLRRAGNVQIRCVLERLSRGEERPMLINLDDAQCQHRSSIERVQRKADLSDHCSVLGEEQRRHWDAVEHNSSLPLVGPHVGIRTGHVTACSLACRTEDLTCPP